jgi:hypothetical protein
MKSMVDLESGTAVCDKFKLMMRVSGWYFYFFLQITKYEYGGNISITIPDVKYDKIWLFHLNQQLLPVPLVYLPRVDLVIDGIFTIFVNLTDRQTNLLLDSKFCDEKAR